MLVEIAKYLRREIASRRQSPLQAFAHYLANDRCFLLAIGSGDRNFQTAFMNLLPANRDRYQSGGVDRRQQGEQRSCRRITGEDIGATPVNHPHHFKVTPESMKERQKTDQLFAVAYKGQGCASTKTLANEVVDREYDTFGLARGAGREHDRGYVVETEARSIL